MALEIILSLIFITIIYYFIINLSNKGPLKSFPLLGMLPEALLNVHRIHDWATDLFERSHLTFIFKGPSFTNMNILATVDPSNIQYIMSSNFSNFPKGPEFNEIFDVMGDGIFNSDSDSWKKQRKAAVTLINHQNFCKFFVKTNEIKVENGLTPILDLVSRQGISVDLNDLFKRLAFDTTCTLVTGFDPECLSIELPEVAFSKALEDAEESIFFRHVMPESVWKLQRWLGIGEEKKLKEAKKVLDQKIHEYIKRKSQDFAQGIVTNNESNGVDLLTSYISQGHEMGLQCDQKFLRDTILSFLFAGRDGISSALTWLFYLLVKNPKAVSRIREDLGLLIPEGKSSQKWLKFDVNDLNQLVYLHGTVCEALRLYPPVPFQHKSPVKADTLPTGHKVEPGTKILFSLYAMGRMKAIWGEDCLQFKPERWISEKGRIKHEPSYKFLTFNAGPRICLGKEVATMQIKLIAAFIIHNYNVELVEEDDHSNGPNVSIILQKEKGLNVTVSSRWPQ